MSDLDYVTEYQHQKHYGSTVSVFDPELQTRVYYSAASKANDQGSIDRVDSGSPALVVFLHGTGTERANGATFNYKANRLSSMGLSTLSFDMPFHKDGPKNSGLARTRKYMKWVNDVIEKHRVPGQKVVLIGHSGGAMMILEYLKRYPKGADAAVSASPVAFDPELRSWYKNHTIKMLKSFPNVKVNEMGARWAYLVERQYQWNRKPTRKWPDPTLVSPELRVRILSGETEEFVPGPLTAEGLPAPGPRDYDICAAIRVFLKNIDCTIAKGIGHKLMEAKDEEGRDLVINEILAGLGNETMAKAKEYANSRRQSLQLYDKLAQKFVSDLFFRQWISLSHSSDRIREIAQSKDNNAAKQLIKEYEALIDAREAKIAENIRSAAATDAEFAEKVRETENMKHANNDSLYAAYGKFLEALPAEARARYAVGNEVYKVEKKMARKRRNNRPLKTKRYRRFSTPGSKEKTKKTN